MRFSLKDIDHVDQPLIIYLICSIILFDYEKNTIGVIIFTFDWGWGWSCIFFENLLPL